MAEYKSKYEYGQCAYCETPLNFFNSQLASPCGKDGYPKLVYICKDCSDTDEQMKAEVGMSPTPEGWDPKAF